MSTKKNLMKNKLLSLATIVTIAFFASKLTAQTSATVTGTTAGAKLIQPMTLSQTSVLHFGTINVLDGLEGTVLLPSNDALNRGFTGGVALSTVAPTATNAAYNVRGTKYTKYALTLPEFINVKETETSENMIISTLKARFTNVADLDATESTLDFTGKDSFTVGGTLNVATGQTPGIYTGSFNVSVDYN
jgi:hypothetical protein